MLCLKPVKHNTQKIYKINNQYYHISGYILHLLIHSDSLRVIGL